MKIRHYLILFLAATAVSCAALTGAASLMTCQYDVKNVTNPRVGGISLANVTNIESLTAGQLAQFSLGMLAGSLPLVAEVNMQITNPNKTAAQIEGLDWQLYFNGANMLSGTTTHPVNVAPNGGRSIVPLEVSVNLMDLFKKESRNEIFQFANGLLHVGESQSAVSLRVRPSFNVGGQIIRGNYFNVTKNI